MLNVYYLAEIFTTFVECYILLCSYAFFFKKRETSIPFWAIRYVGAIIVTAVVLIINAVEFFNIATAYVWIPLVTLVAFLLYRGDLIRIISIAMIYLIIFGVLDFFCVATIELLFGMDGMMLAMMSQTGGVRTLYIVSVKLLTIFIYLYVKKSLNGQKIDLSIKTSILLVAYGILCMMLMQSLLEAFVAEEVVDLKRAVLLAWLFIILCAISFIIIMATKSRLAAEKDAKNMASLQIGILENDNKQLNHAYKEIAKISHDYNNQIRTMLVMAQNRKFDDLEKFLCDITNDTSRIRILTYTGISSIDTVINNIQFQASQLGINMEIIVSPIPKLSIPDIDICAILVNLLDNALEACQRDIYTESKFIQLKVSVVEDMIIIKVNNSYDSQAPIKVHREGYKTVKNNHNLHGFGMNIVKSISQKYNGAFETTFKNDIFTAYVMLNNR